MVELPSGTVTFLFTDIEGSTRLWERNPADMAVALARHDEMLREAIDRNEGVVFSTAGDAFCAAFATAGAALAAACEGTRALVRGPWPSNAQIAVRMALHAGVAEIRDRDYFGQPLNRVARLLAAGHGGQVLLSAAVHEQVRDHLPPGVTLRDMGERRLKDLVRPERIYQAVLPALPADFPPLKTLDARAHNLPIQSTSFVGRVQEMHEVKALVRSSRLVTLTGSGGAGKTRLALQVGADEIDDFAGGVWLAELAPLADPRLVPQEVANAFGVREEPAAELLATLVKALKDKELLLLLDNCEHLIDASARLCDALLAGCANVRILATSREALRVQGERTFRVPSLAVPNRGASVVQSLTQYPAVRLFIDRAVAVHSTFRVDDRNAPAVASICYHLDGIPLALELAAAHMGSLSVEEVNQRLDHRFRLLTGGSRTALPRQQTLRSLIDWSYDLLTDVEQAMLRRVSVFSGGWTLAAAEHVCSGDGVESACTIDLLTSLADKNLIVTEEHEGTTRYRILETIREYALDRLRETSEEAQWRGSHLACFVALAEEFNREINGPKQQAWFSRIASEHDNLRAALAWSAESSPVEGLRLANALIGFWRTFGHLAEGREWLARLLDAFPIDGPTRERARGLRAAATLATPQGDYAAGERLLQESLALYREIDDPNGAGRALGSLAYLSICQGHYPEAEALAREASDRARATGDRRLLYSNLSQLAVALHAQGQRAAARELYEQALEVARELGTPFEMGHALSEIGRAECDEGRRDLARKHFAEGLTILHDLGNRPGVIDSLEGLADVAAGTAAPRRAARLWGAVDALRQEIGYARTVHESVAYERQVKAVRAILTVEAFDQAWDEGRAMTFDDAVRYALDEQAGRDT